MGFQPVLVAENKELNAWASAAAASRGSAVITVNDNHSWRE
jgi:hypothetical protein